MFFAILIPLFLISLASMILSGNNYRTFMQNNIERGVDEAVAEVESDLADLYQLGTGFIAQSNVNKVANRQEFSTRYEQADIINSLREQQTSLCQANDYLSNIIVYFSQSGKAYNANVNNQPSFFEFTKEEWQNAICWPQNVGCFIYQDGQIINRIRPVLNANYLCELQINIDQIWHVLERSFETYTFACTIELADGQVLQAPNNADLNSEGSSWMHFSRTLESLNAQVNFYISEDFLFGQQILNMQMIWILLVCVFVSMIMFVWGTSRLIRTPIKNLMDAFEKFGQLDYSTRIKVSSPSDFEVLYNSFNKMAKEIEVLIERNYEWQIAVNKAELRQLQSQINPHFLYNSFFTLRNLISDELYDESLQLCTDLGQYYRYITRSSGDSVPLAMEYQHACIYINIQRVRFSGRIQTEIDDLPEEYGSMQVPKLIIQPLLENAFKYAFECTASGGILKLSFISDATGVWLIVEDNGTAVSDERIAEINARLQMNQNIQEMSALMNIQKRLQLFFNGGSQLKLSRSDYGGMKVSMWLEWREEHDQIIDC